MYQWCDDISVIYDEFTITPWCKMIQCCQAVNLRKLIFDAVNPVNWKCSKNICSLQPNIMKSI